MSYSEDMAKSVAALELGETVPLGGGIPTTVTELVAALQKRPDGEVFIEIDRNVIRDINNEAVDGATPFDRAHAADDLLYFQWPVVVRYDEVGDVIIHITNGDRAQS